MTDDPRTRDPSEYDRKPLPPPIVTASFSMSGPPPGPPPLTTLGGPGRRILYVDAEGRVSIIDDATPEELRQALATVAIILYKVRAAVGA